MHVVLDATHNDGLAIEVAEDAAQVAVQFVAQGRVAQEWSALFGGEDSMQDDLGQRLRHAVRMSGAGKGCNPFRVDGANSDLLSQGRTALFALWRSNPGLKEAILSGLKGRPDPSHLAGIASLIEPGVTGRGTSSECSYVVMTGLSCAFPESSSSSSSSSSS